MFKNGALPIVGIMRGIRKEDVEPLAGICIKCGLQYIEITMNTEDAPALISEMISISESNLTVGAGTVLTTSDFDLAVNAGAEFIVCPSIIDDVIKKSIDCNIPVFPGALTPTEVHKAWEMGATLVKLFPASFFGPSYIKELKGPFDKIRIMAVGGVNESNIHAFFENGAEAVAFGASIFNLKLLKEGNFIKVEENLKLLIDSYYNWLSKK